MKGAQCSGSSEETEMSLGKRRGSGGQEPAEGCGRCLGDEPGSPPAVIPRLCFLKPTSKSLVLREEEEP